MSYRLLWGHLGKRRYTSFSKIRNIGIVAHIDAGKTTTTERMLFYSGKINHMGNVDQGDTTTDYLPQERERGITIQSAAVSFNWPNKDGCKINLIDTPGHVDFSFEILKSMKVIDGEIMILDAVSGVQSQTQKIWNYSRNIPKILFVNKMDRDGASYMSTVQDIIKQFKTKVAIINYPYFEPEPNSNLFKFKGVVDVINEKILKWPSEDNQNIEVLYINNVQIKEQVTKLKESLIETLGSFDEELIEYYFDKAAGDCSKVPPEILQKSIRKGTITCQISPIICGASFRNIGVQSLLDSIQQYLPSPEEALPPNVEIESRNIKELPAKYKSNYQLIKTELNNLTIAYVFKVLTDPIKGIMIFIRVYSGILNAGSVVFDSRVKEYLKVNKLGILNGDKVDYVKSLHAGEIGVILKGKSEDSKSTIQDLKNDFSTGDTILSHSFLKKNWNKSFKNKLGIDPLSIMIDPIPIPPPVFSATVEPQSLGNRQELDNALHLLCRDDPSLTLREDDDTGQLVLSGMGDLHLQIARSKLASSLKSDVAFGDLRVSYKQSILEASIGNSYPPPNSKSDIGYFFSVTIEPYSSAINNGKVNNSKRETWYPIDSDNNYLIVENGPSTNIWKKRDDAPNNLFGYESILKAFRAATFAGMQSSLPYIHYPLYSVVIRLSENWKLPLDCDNPTEILKIIRNLVCESIRNIQDRNWIIMEPISNITLEVPQYYVGPLVKDLNGKRNANIISIAGKNEDRKTFDAGESVSDGDPVAMLNSQYIPSDPNLVSENVKKSNTNDSSDYIQIKARTPTKCLINYSNKFRSITQGYGSFSMDYFGMEQVSSDRLKDIQNN